MNSAVFFASNSRGIEREREKKNRPICLERKKAKAKVKKMELTTAEKMTWQFFFLQNLEEEFFITNT